MEIVRTELRGAPLVSDYLAGSAQALRFFPAGDPALIETYRRQLRTSLARFSVSDRERAAAALVPTSTAAAERLSRWISQGGAVVTTGQQAGLFTGPLFTIYKALTSVRLARVLEAELGVLVLPVFWIASEDHDWDEVNHTYVVDPSHHLLRLSVSSREPGSQPFPISERTLSADVENAVDKLTQIAINQEFDAEYLDLFRGAYSEGAGVVGAFRDVMKRVLEPFDGFLVDAADPVLKAGSAGVLANALTGWEAEAERLRATAAELEAGGYSTAVPVLPNTPNVLIRTAHGRERLVRDRRGWLGRDSGIRLAAEWPLGILREDPGRVSPNVLLRPVVESAVFPVVAYVAGPGEMAYWSQLSGVFEQHGLAMPPVHPRASHLLVEEEIGRGMEELGVSPDELSRPLHALVEAHARATLAPEIREALRALRTGVVERFDGVTPGAVRLDATLAGAVGATRNRVQLEVGRLERRILRAQKRTESEWAKRLEMVAAHVRPLGSPQERVLSGAPYLIRQGDGLLRALLERTATLVKAHASANRAADEPRTSTRAG